MPGLNQAAGGGLPAATLSLSGTNLTLVIVVAVIAVVRS